MRRAELARFSKWRNRIWVINYKLWATCGCYYDRYVIQVEKDELTDVEAEKLINEDKIKR